MDAGLMRKLARPHFVRAVIVLTLALIGLVIASEGQLDKRHPFESGESVQVLIGAAALLIFGVMSVRMFARGVRAATGEHLGESRSKPLGLVISSVGYVIVVLTVLSLIGADLSGLLLGGALTGVVVGIAAQQTLGNFFAGIVLLLVRPFSVGEEVVLKSGPLGGEYAGLVTEMGFYYVTLETERGQVQLPNAGVLASAVGPGARSDDDEEMDDDPGPQHGGTA
jgi:small-conductance mechanosensitive channel